MEQLFCSLMKSKNFCEFLKTEEECTNIPGLEDTVMRVILNEFRKASETPKKPTDDGQEEIQPCDIIICFPKTVEINAFLDLLEINPDEPNYKWRTSNVYDFEINRANKLSILNAKCIALNAQTNSITAVLTALLIEEFKPKLCILVGIAGTSNESILASATSPETVYNRDGGVKLPEKSHPSPDPISINNNLKKLLYSFEGEMEQVSEKLTHQQVVKSKLEKCNYEIPDRHSEYTFLEEISFKRSNIFSSDSLDKSGKIDEKADSTDRNATTVDMEAHGFATACNESDINWMVFRGYSDHAEPNKNDTYHYVASLSAAYCCKKFLEDYYIIDHETVF